MNAPLKMLLHAPGITISAAFSIWLMCCCLPNAEPLVVPQELPSILSLIYSNIPPIKKGTDSRLGFGFRLGNHADFQVLLELGPQKNTRPIGEDADSENSFNKRQVSKAQRAHLLRKQAQEVYRQLATSTTTERAANSWLESWSNAMNTNHNVDGVTVTSAGIAANKKKSAPKLAQSTGKKQQQLENFTPPAANTAEQSMMQLQMLYRMATASSTTTTSPIDIQPSTELPVMVVTPEPQLQRLRPTFVPYKGGSLNLGGPVGLTPRPLEELALQTIAEQPIERKSKSEITKELMDVSLEQGQ